MEACMLRAAFKTFEGFELMHSELSEKAFWSSNTANAVSTIIPPGWDSDAFSTNLSNAIKFQNLKYAHKAVSPLSKIVKDYREGKGGKSLQKKFYECLNGTIGEAWVPLINDKLSVLGALDGLPESGFTGEDLLGFNEVLRKQPATVKTCFLKTLINSWVTTHRYQEVPLLPCIFGCEDCEDNLDHYLCCDPMWTIAACAASLPSVFLSLTPLERLCLLNKSVVGLRLISVVYRGYHTIRLGHKQLVERCLAQNDFEEIILFLSSLCSQAWHHL